MEKRQLTDQEKNFCELYVFGTYPYCGNIEICYKEAFGDKGLKTKLQAKKLLNDPDVQEFIKELGELNFEDHEFLKRRITENLLKIVDEASVASYQDRNGTDLSPAPLRSVAVQAMKALMEIHPIKEASVNKLSIENQGEGGIVFNVIVPDIKKEREE